MGLLPGRGCPNTPSSRDSSEPTRPCSSPIPLCFTRPNGVSLAGQYVPLIVVVPALIRRDTARALSADPPPTSRNGTEHSSCATRDRESPSASTAGSTT